MYDQEPTEYDRGFAAAMELMQMQNEGFEAWQARKQRERQERQNRCMETTGHADFSITLTMGELPRAECLCGAEWFGEDALRLWRRPR